MKQLRLVLVIVVFINVAGLLAGVGWLGVSGRLNLDRVHQTVDSFRLTTAEEKVQQEKADRLAAQTEQKAQEMAQLKLVEAGPVTLDERMQKQELADEVAAQRYERMKREQQDLIHRLEQARQVLADERAKLDADRKTFEEAKAGEDALTRDENFQQTVEMYESLRPRQSKQMFQNLLAQGQGEQVVTYLAAMQTRKAAAVLKEFKAPEEIVQATDLLQRLRARGVDPVETENRSLSQTGVPG